MMCVQYALEEGGGPGVLPTRPYLHCHVIDIASSRNQKPCSLLLKTINAGAVSGQPGYPVVNIPGVLLLGKRGGSHDMDLYVDGPRLPGSG